MEVLITGSSGFIGSYFCANETRFLLRKFDSSIRINGACDSNSTLQKEIGGCDTVLHLAGLAHKSYTDQQLDDVNHLGTLQLAGLAANAGVKRFVFVSTVNVLGGASFSLPLTENVSYEKSINESKRQAEVSLQKIGRETGMEITIIRPVLVYGKDAPGNMGLLVKIASRLPFTPFGLVNNKRSFISIDNLCDFISLCIYHPKAANEVFLISDDHTVSTPEFMNSVVGGLGQNTRHLPIPVWIIRFMGKLFGISKQVEQLVGDLEVNCSKAKKLLGWTPLETMAQSMAKLK